MKLKFDNNQILKCLDVRRNELYDLEPDNQLPLETAEAYFSEDLLQFAKGNYLIDLGLYGNYANNRSGEYKLFLIRGDFLKGELLELIKSRSLIKIATRIDFYINLPEHILDSIKGVRVTEANWEQEASCFSADTTLIKDDH
jgi:hypothetical protein